MYIYHTDMSQISTSRQYGYTDTVLSLDIFYRRYTTNKYPNVGGAQ